MAHIKRAQHDANHLLSPQNFRRSSSNDCIGWGFDRRRLMLIYNTERFCVLMKAMEGIVPLSQSVILFNVVKDVCDFVSVPKSW